MKQFKDYKNQSKKIFLGIFILSFLAVPFFYSLAQTASEIKDKIEQRNDDISALEKEIAGYQSQLNEIGKQKSSLAGSIKELDLNKKKLTADISVTQKKIDRTNLTIEGLSSQIGTKELSIGSALDAIVLNIKMTDEFEQTSLVESILSDNDFTNIWNDIDNMATLQRSIRANIIELKQVKGELEDTRTETIVAKNELTALRSKLADQKKIVEQNTAAKNKLLSETKNNEANYQKILASRLATKNALEKEVQDYESQLKYILDPKSLPGSGVMSWPLDYVLITQQFGKTSSSGRLYASGTHSGADFRAAVGTPVKAMADGVVAGVGDTDTQCRGASFGKFVLIKYDNGLAATFGHLSLTKVSNGDRVRRGDIVAYSGNTGYSTGPHLHVSMYAKDAVDLKTLPSKSCPGKILTQPIAATTAYLDPLYYLPKTTASMFK
ncbi:MAG: peptidoglycan DD-metalloendopeptidase family protein [Candidatus Pacebacteria bacterium]|nr:peptidoglycan DD-metalloendopeptidase family protein [Candidatus Paceibacterota bacterium]